MTEPNPNVEPKPLNAGEPVPTMTSHGIVTSVEGTTFCICSAAGDMEPGGANGLFYRDARIISRWQLRLDGHMPEPLSALDVEAYTAKFVLRRPPPPGHADSTVLVVRERTIGEGMRETITLQNVGREAHAVRVDMQVDSDFADLFAVKEGHADHIDAQTVIAAADLVLSRPDGTRGVHLSATGEPMMSHGGLTWQAVIPPRSNWTVEILAAPMVDGRRIEPRFREPGAPPIDTPEEFAEVNTRIHVSYPPLAATLRRSRLDLDALRIINNEVIPSRMFIAAGAPWFMTLFGRDSLLTAWMMLPVDPSVAAGTLHTLASLQGKRVDPRTEEEPGRILHELRLGPLSESILGGLNYYGTVDATPLFVSLLAEAWRWGMDEFDVRSLLPAADAALDWMDHYGDRDGDGFLEYQRATDRGLANQGWKDSWDGVNDAHGHLPEPPVALAEVQGYAYTAWLGRAELAEAFGDLTIAADCRQRAAKLRELFADQFWLPEQGWFAVALDRDKRPIDALTSNPGHCLWSGIVSDEHAARLITHLGDQTMDSGYGLRTLSTAMGAYNPMSYHNGSVWPHDTAICIAGLMRYWYLPGAIELAHRLAHGLLDAAEAFGDRLPELFCGFDRNHFAPPVPYPTSCSPQAWASAAPLLILRSFLGLNPNVPENRIVLQPHLPPHWGKGGGTVVLDQLRLGERRVRVAVTPQTSAVFGLPEDWTVVS